jgi:rod shape-determining protein MreC
MILEKYLLGEVVEVNSNFSIVMLISSTEILVPAISLENDSKGIVGGDNGVVRIADVLTAEKLDQNDTIITSGLDGKYPYGLIIGTISEIDRIESELTKSADIETQLELDQLFDVFIIKT